MTKQSKKRKELDGGLSAKAAGEESGVSSLPSWLNRNWLLGSILVCAVILAYQPLWHAGFIWDDDDHVTANPVIIGPLGLKDIWTTSAGKFFPLVLTTFWFEHALWGLAPVPYHLVNVLQHAVSAILLWRVLRLLRIPGAWLGAALWALHPVQVESVAWIAEMKNTQSCVFYLLTIFFFLRWLGASERTATNRSYALTLLCAALAMASKSTTVVLPVVLVLAAWWMDGRFSGRILVRLIPIFFMSMISTAITVWPQPPAIAEVVDPQWARSWPERLAESGDAVWFYLGKLIWPHPLMMVYPRWKVDASQALAYWPLAVVIIVTILLWRKRDTWLRPCFFAWTYFLAVLSPFLGLIDQSFWRYSLVEDHLQYLASMGPLALAGAGLIRFFDFFFPDRLWLPSVLGAGGLSVLALLTWHYAWVFESEETLWADTVAKNPNCWVAQNHLGIALFQDGQVDEAISHIRKALEIYPNYDLGHSNLGNALLQKGDVDEAMVEFQKSLDVNPNVAGVHFNLGLALAQKGRMDEAIDQFQKAVKIDPTLVEVHTKLGEALLQKGEMDEAIEEFQKAVEVNPDDAEAHNDLGVALGEKGEFDQAIAQLQEALRLYPGYTSARENLAKVQAIMEHPPGSH